ncbi:MAG: hypothetical protein PHS73_03370 [Candidatus Peribacteraceae bacterium]|nr:hypothetical protein [Candidatus Peribacteraceae bacterium]
MKHFSLLLFLPLFPVLLLAGCGGTEDPSGKTETGSVATFRYNMPAGGVIIDAEKGKETWFAYGAVAGTEGIPANGLAKSHRFENGQYLHTLQVNIGLPKDGFFYEGWLLHPKTGERISTGHLKSIFGDARHTLSFEGTADLRAYTSVVITLEKDDGNSTPGTEAATGTLKVLKRD